jgi:hypothetical protein
MFALGTIQAGANAKYAEEIWVDDRGIEGGPLAWLEEHFGDPVNTLASSAYVVATMLADGMLVRNERFACHVRLTLFEHSSCIASWWFGTTNGTSVSFLA